MILLKVILRTMFTVTTLVNSQLDITKHLLLPRLPAFGSSNCQCANAVVGKCPDTRDHYWTQWYDEGSPSDDIETFSKIKEKYGICPDVNVPSAIEARSLVGHHEYSKYGNVLSLNPREFRCEEQDQDINCPCKDYKVRFCCRGRKAEATGIVGASCRRHQWTRWLNRDGPTATGDWENRLPHYPCLCQGNTPIAIQARQVRNREPYELSGNLIHIHPDVGFYCINEEQHPQNLYSRIPECKDFEVRYCCMLHYSAYNGKDACGSPLML